MESEKQIQCFAKKKWHWKMGEVNVKYVYFGKTSMMMARILLIDGQYCLLNVFMDGLLLDIWNWKKKLLYQFFFEHIWTLILIPQKYRFNFVGPIHGRWVTLLWFYLAPALTELLFRQTLLYLNFSVEI